MERARRCSWRFPGTRSSPAAAPPSPPPPRHRPRPPAPHPRDDARPPPRRGPTPLEVALAALPDRQREALWLAAVEGFSYAEIASALETSEPSVKALVHRPRG